MTSSNTTTCAICNNTAHRMYHAGPKGEHVICGNCAQKAIDEYVEKLQQKKVRIMHCNGCGEPTAYADGHGMCEDCR